MRKTIKAAITNLRIEQQFFDFPHRARIVAIKKKVLNEFDFSQQSSWLDSTISIPSAAGRVNNWDEKNVNLVYSKEWKWKIGAEQQSQATHRIRNGADADSWLECLKWDFFAFHFVSSDVSDVLFQHQHNLMLFKYSICSLIRHFQLSSTNSSALVSLRMLGCVLLYTEKAESKSVSCERFVNLEKPVCEIKSSEEEDGKFGKFRMKASHTTMSDFSLLFVFSQRPTFYD